MEPSILKFERPEALYLLAVIPLLFALFMLARFQRRKAMKSFADHAVYKMILPMESLTRPWLKIILLLSSLALLVIAIANPQTGSKMEEVKREGIDIFIALDVSNSMLAEDILPNRLERSRQAINRLIDKLTGDRVGIIVFAGKAYMQLPLTTDYNAARMFVSTINTNLVPSQGTAIGEAIAMAVNSFETQTERNKAIIIISDGEDHEENALTAAEEAKNKGITVYTIGMGLADGAPIPVYNEYGKKTGFRKDRNQNTVVTKLNEGLLQQVAAAGNGAYVRANNTRSGLETIFSEINKIAKSEIEARVFTDYENKFQVFLALALLLLIAESLIAYRKTKWETKINLFEKNQKS
ncbi:MAG TPA: VWA domain-containing protein [Bacteroidales bacterium]|nr:VWA domain-containing protein [Bacteroidales bacterium]